MKPDNANSAWRFVLLLAGDIVIVIAAYLLAFFIRSLGSFWIFQDAIPIERLGQVTHFPFVLAASQLAIIYFFGLYDRLDLLEDGKTFQLTFEAITIQSLFLTSFYFFKAEFIYPRSVFIVFWLLNGFLVFFWRRILLRLWPLRATERKVLIVGADKSTEELIREMERRPAYGLRVMGVLSDSTDETGFMGHPIIGSCPDIARICREREVDEVIVSYRVKDRDNLIAGLAGFPHSLRVSVIPSMYELLIGKVHNLKIHDIPLMPIIRQPMSRFDRFIKRCFDLIAATLLFLLTLPLQLVIILAMRVFMPGPIVFRQERLGQNSVPFTVYKYRTMIEDAEKETGPVLAEEDDPRLTALGRFIRALRIDELPQLYNVFIGDMSVVGPRPERACFVERFIKEIPGYCERYRVKPGLTGLAQINGGYATSAENKLRYDLAYIYNQSLWLDMSILTETIKVILTGKPAP